MLAIQSAVLSARGGGCDISLRKAAFATTMASISQSAPALHAAAAVRRSSCHRCCHRRDGSGGSGRWLPNVSCGTVSRLRSAASSSAASFSAASSSAASSACAPPRSSAQREEEGGGEGVLPPLTVRTAQACTQAAARLSQAAAGTKASSTYAALALVPREGCAALGRIAHTGRHGLR